METDTNEVYKRLKKQNGEHFAQVIRSANLLDLNNIVHIVKFAGKKTENAESIVQYLSAIKQHQQHEKTNPEPIEYTDPIKLLKRAGYDAFVADTEKKKNSIRKYYRPNEELCTFRDSHRHEDFYIIHAVKENAKNIIPNPFPERQDEYGTSVISIQIAKTGGFISIKNRYNHTVNNPDSTFNGNPDNIIHGLSYSLQKFFNVSFGCSEIALPRDYIIINDQIVHYNYEVDNMYFGENCYCNGSGIVKIDKTKELMMDYFILNKRFGVLLNPSGVSDSFVEVFNKEIKGKKIKTTKDKNTSETVILTIGKQKKEIARVLGGKITTLSLDTKFIGDSFLLYNEVLQELSLPKLQTVGDSFFYNNKKLQILNLPKLKSVGNAFLLNNRCLQELKLPKLQTVGNTFLDWNEILQDLTLPKLQTVGNAFLCYNISLQKLKLPKLQSVGDLFLYNNRTLRELNLPKLQKTGSDFLYNAMFLRELNLPKLQKVEFGFLCNAMGLNKLNLPKLQKVESFFLHNNTDLQKLKLPQLKSVGDNFLHNNMTLQELNLPQLQSVGNYFLRNNMFLRELNLPNLKFAGDYFLYNNITLQALYLPQLQKVGRGFLGTNTVLQKINLPKLQSVIRGNFLDNIAPALRTSVLVAVEQTSAPFMMEKKREKQGKEVLGAAPAKIKKAMSINAEKMQQIISDACAHKK